MEDDIEQTPPQSPQTAPVPELAPPAVDAERHEDIAVAAEKALGIMGIEDPSIGDNHLPEVRAENQDDVDDASEKVPKIMGIDSAEVDTVKANELAKLEEIIGLEREIVDGLKIDAYQTTHEQLNEVYLSRLDDIAKSFGAEGVEVIAGRLTSRQAGKNFEALLENGANPRTLLRKMNTLDVGLHATELLDAGVKGDALVTRMEPDDILDKYDRLTQSGVTKESMKARIVAVVGEDSPFVAALNEKAA